MIFPRDQLQYRAQEDATITLLQPTGQLLFTIDQHYSASVPTLVRVGWDPVDETYTIGQVDIGEVPVDLRELVILLQTSEFAPQGSASTPELQSQQATAELQRIENRLLSDYPIATELAWPRMAASKFISRGACPYIRMSRQSMAPTSSTTQRIRWSAWFHK